jgi:hypothetical protein
MLLQITEVSDANKEYIFQTPKFFTLYFSKGSFKPSVYYFYIL